MGQSLEDENEIFVSLSTEMVSLLGAQNKLNFFSMISLFFSASVFSKYVYFFIFIASEFMKINTI